MRPKTISRDMIVDAALCVINEKGLAAATTRAIVQAVPCSEGSLYLHFADRTELLVAVMARVVSGFTLTLAQLRKSDGRGVEKQLLPVLQQALEFHRTAMPVLAGVLSDLTVLRAFQKALQSTDRGPHSSRDRVAAFIGSERAAGRIQASVQPELAAAMLLYAAFGRAFEEHFTGRCTKPGDLQFCKATVATILHRR